MNSLTVDKISKVYRKGGVEFSPWQSLMARLGRAPAASKKSREIWALKNVSFAVEPGTILGVIGPNGAGKTTLLKVLARVTPPSEGRIVGRGTVAPLLELGTGLQGELTARENIILYAAWHGVPRAEIEQRIAEIVAFAELEEFLESPLKQFSSGMYVRLAFSIAVNMRPDILLADEVLAVGDISFQERCLQRVEEAGSAGMTVLFVSHDMAAIQRLCHRVIWLSAGQVMQDGDPEAVVSAYEQAAWTLTGGTAKQGKKGKHANAHGEILSIRLLSADGREIGAVQHSDDVYLTLAFTLLTPGAIVRAVFAVYTRGILAFRAVQPEDLHVVESGLYTARVRIPGHFLADTIYTVKPGIFISVGGEESPLAIDNGMTFRVYAEDTGGQRTLLARGNYKGSSWAGAVMPRLEWEVVKQRDIVSA
jgi:lipopolysaccharide transport system ATP-binding protein